VKDQEIGGRGSEQHSEGEARRRNGRREDKSQGHEQRGQGRNEDGQSSVGKVRDGRTIRVDGSPRSGRSRTGARRSAEPVPSLGQPSERDQQTVSDVRDHERVLRPPASWGFLRHDLVVEIAPITLRVSGTVALPPVATGFSMATMTYFTHAAGGTIGAAGWGLCAAVLTWHLMTRRYRVR
jgi:hypothetical protein